MIQEELQKLLREVLSKELHVFEREGKKVVFGKKSGYLKLLSKQAFEQLSLFTSGLSISEIARKTGETEDAVAETLFGIYADIKSRKIIKSGLESPDSVQLIVSDGCNMQCSYCYGKYYKNMPVDHLMSKEIGIKAVEFAHAVGAKNIGFFGGEPLLNFHLVKAVIEYCEKKGYVFQFGMTTNGTLVTKEIAEYAKKHKLLISVSVDGDSTTHNLSRKYPSGKGSYADVLRGIKLLKESGCLYMLEMTYSNNHPEELKPILASLSDVHNCISCTCVEGRGSASFSSEIIQGDRLRKYYNDMFDFFIESKLNGKEVTLGGMNELIAAILAKETVSKEYLCASIMGRVSIGIDGTIYPCPETMASEFAIANVCDPDVLTSFEQRRKQVLEKLKKDNLKAYWFSDLSDICFARITERNKQKEIDDSPAIASSIEDVLYKVAAIYNA